MSVPDIAQPLGCSDPPATIPLSAHHWPLSAIGKQNLQQLVVIVVSPLPSPGRGCYISRRGLQEAFYLLPDRTSFSTLAFAYGARPSLREW
eukprot:5098408-Pleurochrysis_carterae.AAC.1